MLSIYLSIEWTQNGGIIGRGVLIDWADWASRNNISIKPLQTGAISIQDIKTIIQEQKIEIRQGDILFIRVGFTAAYNALTPAQQQEYPDRDPSGLLGLEATKESLRWLWESRLAALASDSPSVERGPVNGPYNDPDVSLHQWALAGWGLPLGEMFDLDELASTARSLGRYSFFLSSVPIKVCGYPSWGLVGDTDHVCRSPGALQARQMPWRYFEIKSPFMELSTVHTP